MMTRCSGILLHVTSISGPYGIGDLGPRAFEFVDTLVAGHQSIWQVLPLVPVGYGNSPYASPSTFAGNTLLISPDLLAEEDLVPESVLPSLHVPSSSTVNFEIARSNKHRLLKIAYSNFEAGKSKIDRSDYDGFCNANAFWLNDYALFEVIKEMNDGRAWTEWPVHIAKRDPGDILEIQSKHQQEIELSKFSQYLFFRQWKGLKAHANDSGISILGDLPIYVAHDSADVWSNPELFLLDEDGNALEVAGVPPDYFSETGQRWGNPIYNWKLMRERTYAWWTMRLQAILDMVDVVRLDHFRGFEAYWSVPAHEETAVNGQWTQGPGASLFDHFVNEFNGIPPIVAEDLGVITDGVVGLMQRYNFPGMAILQFGFDEGASGKFLPHNYERNLVAYSGTHDNDTVAGWFTDSIGTQAIDVANRARKYCQEYLQFRSTTPSNISDNFMWALLASVANWVILPVQDVIGLDSSSRMNTPGKTEGNWTWRLLEGQFEVKNIKRLKRLTETYGRSRR